AAGELGEVVRLVQPFVRLPPEPAVDEVVPLRNEVVDRAARRHAFDERAGVAEWHSAVHAAGALLGQVHDVGVPVKLGPVADAFRRRMHARQLARIFEKAGRLTHVAILSKLCNRRRLFAATSSWLCRGCGQEFTDKASNPVALLNGIGYGTASRRSNATPCRF